MDEKVTQEILEELFSSLEVLEAQNRAILQFLKKRDMAGDEDFAPFLEEAAKASNVRWRATRTRVNHLLSSASKADKLSQETSPRATEKNDDQDADKKTPEEPRNSEQREKTAERSQQDSGAEIDHGAPEKNSDSDHKVEGSELDKPANKDAA
jgi:hypothetical protein